MTEQLADRRRAYEQAAGGPGRLLRALVRNGLDPDAVVPAAALMEREAQVLRALGERETA